MKHYLVDKQIVNDRMRQYRQKADNERLAQLTQVYRPSLGGRILAGLGGWMIAGGTRLKARYEAGIELSRQDAKLEIVGY